MVANVEVPVTERSVVVAFVAVRLVKTAVRAERRDEKNPVVLVLLVEKRLVAVKAVADAVASTV